MLTQVGIDRIGSVKNANKLASEYLLQKWIKLNTPNTKYA